MNTVYQIADWVTLVLLAILFFVSADLTGEYFRGEKKGSYTLALFMTILFGSLAFLRLFSVMGVK